MATQKDPTIFGYQNFYSTTLTGDITSGTLTIGLATVPTPTSGILVIEPDSTSSRELILYTSKGASTVTCPSDGRGWSGSTAAPHLQGSTVIMASVDEYFEGLSDGTLSTDPIRTSLIKDHVVSGGVVAQSAGLVGTFSNIVFYLNQQRYSGSSIANKTYTASKDTYVDITASSGGTVSVTYTEVANGAASPALAASYVRIAKVVTNGSAITSVTQPGVDTLGNIIYPRGAVSTNSVQNPYKFSAYRTAAQNATAGAFAKVNFDTELFDTGSTFDTTNKRFTAPVAGYYFFSARQSFVPNTVGLIALYKNGTAWRRGNHSNGTVNIGLEVNSLMYLAAGDYVEVFIFSTTANSLEGNTTEFGTFDGFMVSAS